MKEEKTVPVAAVLLVAFFVLPVCLLLHLGISTLMACLTGDEKSYSGDFDGDKTEFREI